MYVSSMFRVHVILLIGALFGGLFLGCSSSRKEYYLPAIHPEEDEKTVRPKADDPDCVVDTKNLVFHREGCPKLGELPEADKAHYESVYAPLNRGYSPCAVCQPLRGHKLR